MTLFFYIVLLKLMIKILDSFQIWNMGLLLGIGLSDLLYFFILFFLFYFLFTCLHTYLLINPCIDRFIQSLTMCSFQLNSS